TIVLAKHRAVRYLGDLPKLNLLPVAAVDRYRFHLIDRIHSLDRYLHLHLISNAALGVSPKVWRGVAAGAGGFGERSASLLRRDAHHAAALTVEVNFDRWIIQLLLEREIAQ